MLNVLSMQHHSISDEGFGMTNKARIVEIFSAGVALFVPMNLVWGQSCQCDNSPVAGLQQYLVPLSNFADPQSTGQQAGLTYKPGRLLPEGWPNQWGGPAFLNDAGQVAKKEATAPATQADDLKTQQNADKRGKTANDADESSQKKPATSGLISSLMVRDPFSGRMVPTSSQARWAQGEETTAAIGVPTGGDQRKVESQPSTGASSNVERKQSEANTGTSARVSKETIGGTESSTGTSTKSSARSWSVLPSRGQGGGGPAIGGGTGGIGGGGGGANGGINGGNGGGGSGIGGNGWNWSPETGGAGGAAGGNGGGQTNTGVLDYVETIEVKPEPPTDGPGKDPVDPPTDGPDKDPVDPPADGPGDDLTDIPLPDPLIPDVTPDVPTGDDPSQCGVGHNTPPGNGDSPVVPEPGSIILLGIAGGVGGAGFIRRRLKKAKAVEK